MLKDFNMVSTQFIIDNKGRKRGVILSMEEYEKMMEDLDEAACVMAFDKAIKEKDEVVPAREAFAMIERKRKRARSKTNV